MAMYRLQFQRHLRFRWPDDISLASTKRSSFGVKFRGFSLALDLRKGDKNIFMIARAIVSLLKHNNRVNLPTLGAIIKQQDFSQSLFFNQFIKHDDGLLSTHLIKIEMLTDEEAKEAIHGFIKSIQDGIQHNGRFKIEELGIFCYADGRLELLNEKEYQHMSALSGISITSEIQKDLTAPPEKSEVTPSDDSEKKINAPANGKPEYIQAENGDSDSASTALLFARHPALAYDPVANVFQLSPPAARGCLWRSGRF